MSNFFLDVFQKLAFPHGKRCSLPDSLFAGTGGSLPLPFISLGVFDPGRLFSLLQFPWAASSTELAALASQDGGHPGIPHGAGGSGLTGGWTGLLGYLLNGLA